MKNAVLDELPEPTDKEINEIAEWLEGLTVVQLQFIKDSYNALLNAQAHAEHGNYHVH